MAKISKNEFKQLVKECLLEILGEQIIATAMTEVVKKREVRSEQDTSLTSKRAVSNLNPPARKITKQIQDELNENNQSSWDSIFQDTMRTTLPKMIEGEKGSSGGSVSNQLVEQVSFTPEEIFGEEETERWAALAFAPNKKQTA